MRASTAVVAFDGRTLYLAGFGGQTFVARDVSDPTDPPVLLSQAADASSGLYAIRLTHGVERLLERHG